MNLKREAIKLLLKGKKYSPELLTALGVVTFVGAIVVACKQTLKADEILDAHREDMERVEEAKQIAAENEDDERYEYPAEQVVKDKINVYAHTIVKFGKLYLPAIGLGVVSLASFLGANKILKMRYVAVTAAFNAVNEAFERYRKRVIEEGGVDLDRHYMYGAERSKMEIVDVDESGKVTKHKEVVETINSDNGNLYSRFFDSSCEDWDKNPELNMQFLQVRQTWANNMLQTRGHLFLNEVYDMLGFERSAAGSVVGWVLGNGDDFVDFGLYNQDSKSTRRFVNGLENVILLDFNVDGVIYDKI